MSEPFTWLRFGNHVAAPHVKGEPFARPADSYLLRVREWREACERAKAINEIGRKE